MAIFPTRGKRSGVATRTVSRGTARSFSVCSALECSTSPCFSCAREVSHHCEGSRLGGVGGIQRARRRGGERGTSATSMRRCECASSGAGHGSILVTRLLLSSLVVVALYSTGADAARSRPASRKMRTLWNCASDIVSLCSDVEPGDGRVEACLKRKKAFITSMCGEMRERPDPLPPACKTDAAALCPEAPGGGERGLQLMCLRKNRNKLAEACWQQISRLQSDGWEPLPIQLNKYGVDSWCARGLMALCKGVAPGYGALRKCVEANARELHDRCGTAAPEDPEPVADECEGDAMKLCKNIARGDGRIHACLEGKRFSVATDCKSALLLRAAGLDMACARDVTKLCRHGEETREELITCLHYKESELSLGCSTRHLKMTPQERGHYGRVDLQSGKRINCEADIKRFCRGIEPGHGHIQACLIEHREFLSEDCVLPKGQVYNRAIYHARVAANETGQAKDKKRRDGTMPLSGGGPAHIGMDQGAGMWRGLVPLTYDEGLGAFERSDEDRDGQLNISELHEALKLAYLHHDYKRALAVEEGFSMPEGPERDRLGASDVMYDADEDGTGALGIEEFRSLFSLPDGLDEEAAGEEQRAEGGGQWNGDPHGHNRQFADRSGGLITRLSRNPWVTTPLAMLFVFLVFTYRSTARRSDKPGRRRGASGGGLSRVVGRSR